MFYRANLQLFLILLLTAGTAIAQSPADSKPVSKIDVFIALEAARDGSEELILKTNAELLAAISTRGVDFVLTPEEEWQLGMRNASEDLLTAIREAVDPKEREARITANNQQRLHAEFSAGYNANDLASRRAALTAAREFVSLYAADPNVAEIVTFMQRNLPRLEQGVTMMAQREEAMERARAQAVERQQQIEMQRQERDRRRQEASANNPNSSSRRTTDANRPAAKEDATPPPARQPSDPVPVRTPRYPVVRRP